MNTNKLRILVVDDDEDDFLIVRDLLRPSAELDHVSTPESALEAVQGRPYDLLLLDYLLGAESGLDLLKAVRRLGVETPVIFLTGRGDEEIAVEALKAGACDYLLKSKLTEPALSRAVAYAVRLHHDAKLLREAQEKLRSSEEKFRALIENISDTVTVLDGAGVVRYANGSGALGYSEQENVGRSGFELLHPDDLDRVRSLYLDCVRSPEGRAEAECRVRHKDGTWRTVEATAVNHLAHPAIGGIIVSYHDVTERKRGEEALRFSDEIVRHARAVIVAMNLQGEVIYVSDSVKAFLGYELADVAGEKWWQVTYFERGEAKDIRNLLGKAVGDDSAHPIPPFTRRVRHKDGSARWMLWNLSKVPDGLIIAIGHDVTALKETETALKSANEQLSMLLDSLPVAVYRADAKTGATTYISGEVSQISGYAADQFLHQAHFWFDHIHPDDRVLARQAVASAIEHGACTYEYRFLCADGNYRWMLDSSRLVRTESSDPDYVVGMWLQIDDRKRAEEALRLQSTALEAAANAIVITDKTGTILWVNPAFERLTGYSQSEAVGQTPRILKSGEQDAAFYENLWATVLAGKVWNGELVNKKKDGSKYVEEMTITPLRDADGSVQNFIGVKQDITERRSLRERLAQAQKMEAVGRLSGGVAHDFNNILGVILGYAELVQEKIPELDPLHRQVKEIHRAGERAASLTRQLLAFSRQQVLQPVVLNLNTVVSEMDKMLHRLIGEDIEITTTLARDLCSIKADRSQIEQIVMNLAVNARDAMPMGGHLSIETSNCVLDEIYTQQHGDVAPGEYVMLAVSDTGVGMPRDVQAHVFEPFFTTKEAGKGTGLGLATVYGIVKQSGGHIWVYSEPGNGTAFKVYFPAVAAPEAAAREELPEGSGGSERILLVEDSRPLRELTRDLLQISGYDVLEAADAKHALALVCERNDPIDLLITDVVMPGMSGPQLAEKLQQQCPGIRVLYVSGYTDHAVLTSGQLDRQAAFLQKPFTRQALCRKVREVLGPVAVESVAP